MSLSPQIFSLDLHKKRTAHELFHFVQSHLIGEAKSTSRDGLWWIEANAGRDVILRALSQFLTPYVSLMEATGEFALFCLLGEAGPISGTLLKKGGAEDYAVPLDTVVKPCPTCAEQTAMPIGPGKLATPLEYTFALPAGFTAKMWALELKPQSTGAPQPPRSLTVGARTLERGWAKVFVGRKRQWLKEPLLPAAELKWPNSRATVTLGGNETLYVVAVGFDDAVPGAAVIRVSDGPALALVPATFKGTTPSQPFDVTATLTNAPEPLTKARRGLARTAGADAVTFRWTWRNTLTGARQDIVGESKPPDPRIGSAESAQAIRFPGPGSYVLTCAALDADGATIAESLPVPCEVGADAPEPREVAPPARTAAPTPRTGYWRLVESRSLERTLRAGTTGSVNVSDGSISGTETSTGSDGPAIWAGECAWVSRSSGALDRLVPGQVVDVSMTVRDRSVPEKASGWNHGYTGVGGSIRFDKPYQGLGVTHSSGSDLVNVGATWQKSNPTPAATQKGTWTVPPGPGPSQWDGKAALGANCSFGRFERVYEWTTDPSGIKTGPAPGPAPSMPSVTGTWTGSWTNSLGEKGNDSLVLEERSDGTVVGTWSGTVRVTGRRIDAATVELSGRTATRAYEVTGSLRSGTLTLTYVTRRLDRGGSYRGASTLTRNR